YSIWVSEVMLQQTQVATVLPYYQRFVEALPSVGTLAHAPLQRVLKLWEGLGYYARARNLHRAAQQVIKRWNGKLPSDPALLQTLPGVGRSTAGAIASLAFGKRAPILDGNLRRLFTRILAIESPLDSPSVQQQLWAFSERILPKEKVAQFNQALMDLGATVCTPKQPDCLLCPVRDLCQAFHRGIQARIPISTHRKELPHRHMVVAIIFRDGRLLITKRAEEGLLGGLWGLPEVPIGNSNKHPQAKQGLLDLWGVGVNNIQSLKPLDHTFTHFRMTYHPMLCRYVSGTLGGAVVFRWVSPQELSEFPFSSAMRKILARLPSLEHSYQEPAEQHSLAAEYTTI
ncbi:MAG: A/G-specific adenine glycosylase, partial [Nitrospiria bacterium]